jgi:hypothetical protein
MLLLPNTLVQKMDEINYLLKLNEKAPGPGAFSFTGSGAVHPFDIHL